MYGMMNIYAKKIADEGFTMDDVNSAILSLESKGIKPTARRVYEYLKANNTRSIVWGRYEYDY